jgi:hypothetical protein
MKLKDGVEFKLGMTVYTAESREIKTDPEGWTIDSFGYEGEMVHCLCRTDGGGGIDLLRLYSSRAAIICGQMRRATDQIRYWADEVVRLSKLLTQVTA